MLSSKVTLQREGNSLHFSLIGEASEAPPPRPIDEALTDAQHLSPALKTLLDCHPKMRSAERHLAYAEGALATLGTKDMAEVPIEVLTIAVGQLELLVNNWSNRALAELRSMMAVAIGDRSRDAISAQDKLSNFFAESRLAVGDASQSMFMDLERQYQQALPAPSIQAALDSVKSSPPRRPSLHVSDQPQRGQFQ